MDRVSLDLFFTHGQGPALRCSMKDTIVLAFLSLFGGIVGGYLSAILGSIKRKQ